MHIYITSGDLFLKNRRQLNLSRVKHALAFVEAAGGPAGIYISLRVLARFLVGKRRRDNIIRQLHLNNFSAFLNLFSSLDSLAESSMVKEVEMQIGGRHFSREPAVCSLLLNKRGRSFIDIGANIGYYSFLLHNNFDEILAIEPHPRNYKEIQKIKVRHDYDKIRMLQIAVSDQNGEAKLYLSSDCGRHTLLDSSPNVQRLKPNYVKVRTATLDSLLKKGVGVDLIKVDVEGAEWKVLNGAKKVMDNIKSWLIELHELTRRKELENSMKSYGYNVWWIDYNHMYALRRCGRGR